MTFWDSITWVDAINDFDTTYSGMIVMQQTSWNLHFVCLQQEKQHSRFSEKKERIPILARGYHCASQSERTLFPENDETDFPKELFHSSCRSVCFSPKAFFGELLFIWNRGWGGKLFGDGRRGWSIACGWGWRKETGRESFVDASTPLSQEMSLRQSLVNESGIENM